MRRRNSSSAWTRARCSCTHSWSMTRRPSGSLVFWAQARTSVSDALDDPGRAQGDPLVVELVGDEVPALVLAADQAGGRHAHVLVEGVVDVVVAQQLHGDHLDAGRVHRDHEHGDALVLGHVGIGAGGQPDVVGVAGQAGEDLRAVDDVLVAVADGPGGQRGQVGARVGLGVADAEVDLAGQDLGEEELLLLLGAEVHDGRADRVDGEHRHRAPRCASTRRRR